MGVLALFPVLITTIALILTNTVSAIHFDMDSTYSKCFTEYMHVKGLVLANYHVVTENAPNISVKVTSPYGSAVYTEERVTTGGFAFTAYEEGDYTACFWVADPPKEHRVITVSLDWKTGIAAKDWESVAKREKIEGVELELVKLQESANTILGNMLYLREKEQKMRTISETANARMAWCSITSLLVCLIVAGLQLLYLKSFFVRKKLL